MPSVQEIIVERVLEKVQKEGHLPWQRPFLRPCMNWYSGREYRGINRILLMGGEYITFKQLCEYNKKNGTNFRLTPDKRTDYAVFYKVEQRPASGEEIAAYESGKLPRTQFVRDKASGVLYRKRFILRYYRVFELEWIKDEDGNTLPRQLGGSIIETYTPAEQLLNPYLENSGVSVAHDGRGKCFYSRDDDTIHLMAKEYFLSAERYYRTLFHEAIHSTGIDTRLHRECYERYHREKKERSREEVIAEMGSLILATEAGFRDELAAENSENYIAGWADWMRENPNELILGMQQAEKAAAYIMNGGVMPVYSDEEATSIQVGTSQGASSKEEAE